MSRKGRIGVSITYLFIDNTLIVRNKEEIKKFKEEIKSYFKTKEEEDMKEYVVWMVTRIDNEMFLHQNDLIKKLEK